jgi:hypothetical protein
VVGGQTSISRKITGSSVRYYGSLIRIGVPTVKKTLSVSSSIVAAKDQVSSDLGGEVAILHLKSGVYYGLDGVGARIWDLTQEPRTVEEVRDVILSEYDVEPNHCQSDLITLLQRLADEGLIEVKDGISR